MFKGKGWITVQLDPEDATLRSKHAFAAESVISIRTANIEALQPLDSRRGCIIRMSGGTSYVVNEEAGEIEEAVIGPMEPE